MLGKSLSKDDIKTLRGIGHRLSPVVIIGANGLTPTVIEEVARALGDHELIKIKIPAGSADERKNCINALAQATESTIIHNIGRMVLLLRRSDEPNDKLSNLVRFDFS